MVMSAGERIEIYDGTLPDGNHDISLALLYRGQIDLGQGKTGNFAVYVPSSREFFVNAGEYTGVEAAAYNYGPPADNQSGVEWRVQTTTECSVR